MLPPVHEVTEPEPIEVVTDQPRKLKTVRDFQDKVFRVVATTGGVTVLLIMLLVGTFLAIKASQAPIVPEPSVAWKG